MVVLEVVMSVRIDLPTPGTGSTHFEASGPPDVGDWLLTRIGRWAEDCGLPEHTREDLELFTQAGLAHGLRFRPHELAVALPWVDVRSLGLCLRWRGGAATATIESPTRDVVETISVLDERASAWGISGDRGGWVHWMIAQVHHAVVRT